MLSRKPGKKLNIYVPDYVIFDLETTGISSVYDEVVEISAVKVQNSQVVEEFTALVNPGVPIPPQASAVNGITDEMVAVCPGFEEVFSQFLDFVQDAVLVGHNIHSFDMKFLYRDAERFWGETLGNDYIDTLQISRMYLPALGRHRLTDLASHYGIATEGAHRALNDCRMNQQVFENLGREIAKSSTKGNAAKICPRCGSFMQKRNGKYGTFWGCTGYPACRYTENL